MKIYNRKITKENINDLMFKDNNEIFHTPVEALIKKGEYDNIKKIVETLNPDLSKLNQYDNTMLHLACDSRICPTQNYAIIKLLLEQPGVDINALNASRCSPMQLAISCPNLENYIEIIQLFLEHKDINIKCVNANKDNLAHTAVKQACADVLGLLWRAGVDLLYKNRYSETPLEYIKRIPTYLFKDHDLADTIAFLEEYQDKPPRQIKSAYSCIAYEERDTDSCVSYGECDTVEMDLQLN